MMKYFCDRCGKEVKETIQIQVPQEKRKYGDFTIKYVGVCEDCKKEFDKIINKLVDIRFVLFNDFMK